MASHRRRWLNHRQPLLRFSLYLKKKMRAQVSEMNEWETDNEVQLF